MPSSPTVPRVWLAAVLGACVLAVGSAGTARAADGTAELSPRVLTFTPVKILTDGSSDGFMALTNTGAFSVAITNTTLTGSDTAAFAMLQDTCTGVTLAPGEACGYSLRFSPQHIGAHGAQLNVSTTGAPNPVPGQLVGTGIAPPRPEPPVNILLPTISGTPEQGKALSCSPGTWSDASATFDYFWARGGAGITDASLQDYTLQYDDVGYEITCRAFANTGGGRVVAISKPVVPIDRITPVCTLKANSQNMPTVKAKGFLVTATCSEPVSAKFTLAISKADRRKYKLPSVTIGTDDETFATPGATSLRILLNSTAKKRLRKAKRLRFTAALVALDRVRLQSKRATVTATAKPSEPTEEE